MLKRNLALAAVLVVAFAFVVGCDNNAEQQRSVITVASMNCSAPAYSDVIGDTGSISDTWVPVIFENRPYNMLVTTDTGYPHGDFIITQYTIEWTSLDTGAPLPSRVERTSTSIPSGDIGGMYVRLVGLAEKTGPVLAPVQLSGTRFMQANITFLGHESGTERKIEIETSVAVEFANFADEDVENCDLQL